MTETKVLEPDPATPLVFKLSGAQYKATRTLIGEGSFNRVAGLLYALDQQVDAQLGKDAYRDLADDVQLEFRCRYGEYLEVLGVIGQVPYVRAANVVHHLARLVEAQLHSASHLQLEAASGRKQ